jgi:hypothetical protein
MQALYLTLTDSGTVYNLKTLAKAQVSTFRDVSADQIRLQSAKGNTGDIYIGGPAVSSTNYGATLLNAGDALLIGRQLDGIHVVADAASQIVAVLLT